MTRVDELRERLVDAELDSGSVGTEKEAREVIDSLISAARAEGVAEGKEAKRLEILSTLSWNVLISESYERGKAEGEERLQKYTAEYLKEGIKRCSAALAQGKAEGAAEERETIKRTCLDGIGVWDGYVMVPDSVLAPFEQEKITRLAEIVADMSAEEPPVEIITRAGPVLAPTKEGGK